jgi:hypothetical protein
MNRQERRAISTSKERIIVTGIVVHFANGQYINLDITKVEVLDKHTGRPLFDEVLEAVEASPVVVETPDGTTMNVNDDYSVAFDTPEGRMQYVKKGNWSGIKKL